jgi:hypothetical protein
MTVCSCLMSFAGRIKPAFECFVQVRVCSKIAKPCLQDPAKLKSFALERNLVLPELTLRLSIKSTAYVFVVHLQHFGTIFAFS